MASLKQRISCKNQRVFDPWIAISWVGSPVILRKRRALRTSNLRDAGVDLLQHRAGWICSAGCRLWSRQTEAEQELLVFFIELENLKNSRAGVFEQVAGFRFTDAARRDGAQRRQRLIELAQQLTLSFHKLGGERPLVLPKETVFLERALVQLVT